VLNENPCNTFGCLCHVESGERNDVRWGWVLPMSPQVTRHNHYVPEWYQRGFLKTDDLQLYYLDMSPEQKVLADGRTVTMNSLAKRGPKSCFQEYDLYSTRFGTDINDEVEKFLFGSIDVRGAKALRAFAAGDPSEMHNEFHNFFEFIDAQKLRTPKGLDWIKARYTSLDQTQLMVEMQGLRFSHCTMWAEGVREIVSAEDSGVKFILSDHPVTLYNASVPPTAHSCAYPDDPSIEWIGTQTVFVLNPDTCLVLTHLEYAQDQGTADLTAPRTHARYRGSSLVRTDAFIRTRKLSEKEVVSINYLLKRRARRFIASSHRAWLFPEQSFTDEWSSIAQVLVPKNDLWRFGGEIFVGYADGRTSHQDAFGRTSGAHEYLRRKAQKSDPLPNESCGCGSGYKFKRCCQGLSPQDRPTWEFYGIRERNLLFCHEVQDILGLNNGKSWQDVQRELTDDQVRRIHEAFGSLWPEDTGLPSLLPRPKSGILRAVYLGISDPRLISSAVLGWLPYFDEIILAHPFVNPLRIRPEYSPTLSPSQYKEQTLKNVQLLLMLQPFIHAGYIHLIPDPGDFDSQFAGTVHQMVTERTAGWKPTKKHEDWQEAIIHDDYRRAVQRAPEASLRHRVRQQMPEASDAQIDAVVAHAKIELEADPYALLQPVGVGESNAQLHSFKGFAMETGMFLASLTGSFVYTDSDVHWQQLHLHAQATGREPNVAWTSAIADLQRVAFTIELDGQPLFGALLAGRFIKMRREFRPLVDAIRQHPRVAEPSGVTLQISRASDFMLHAWSKVPPGQRLTGQIELSVPAGGFDRNEVRRLLLTFGRAKLVHPIALAMLIKFGKVVDDLGAPSTGHA
jgi:hypothetical protein